MENGWQMPDSIVSSSDNYLLKLTGILHAILWVQTVLVNWAYLTLSVSSQLFYVQGFRFIGKTLSAVALQPFNFNSLHSKRRSNKDIVCLVHIVLFASDDPNRIIRLG
jgi:hypothetical protein